MARGTWDDDQDAFVEHGVEKWILTLDVDHLGRRTATRSPCHWPVLVASSGDWKRASDRVIADTLADLRHEQHRRAGTLNVLGGWDRPWDPPLPDHEPLDPQDDAAGSDA